MRTTCQPIKNAYWDIPDINGEKNDSVCPGKRRTLTTPVTGGILKSSQ